MQITFNEGIEKLINYFITHPQSIITLFSLALVGFALLVVLKAIDKIK